MAKSYDVSLESSLPIVNVNGLNTNKDAYLGGAVEVVGALTLDSTSNFVGAASFASVAASSTITAGGAVTATGAVISQSTLNAKNSTAYTTTAAQAIQVSSSALFGIFYGNGVPAATAVTGSIYMNVGGSSTGTRMYVNAGGATWYGMVSGT